MAEKVPTGSFLQGKFPPPPGFNFEPGTLANVQMPLKPTTTFVPNDYETARPNPDLTTLTNIIPTSNMNLNQASNAFNTSVSEIVQACKNPDGSNMFMSGANKTTAGDFSMRNFQPEGKTNEEKKDHKKKIDAIAIRCDGTAPAPNKDKLGGNPVGSKRPKSKTRKDSTSKNKNENQTQRRNSLRSGSTNNGKKVKEAVEQIESENPKSEEEKEGKKSEKVVEKKVEEKVVEKKKVEEKGVRETTIQAAKKVEPEKCKTPPTMTELMDTGNNADVSIPMINVSNRFDALTSTPVTQGLEPELEQGRKRVRSKDLSIESELPVDKYPALMIEATDFGKKTENLVTQLENLGSRCDGNLAELCKILATHQKDMNELYDNRTTELNTAYNKIDKLKKNITDLNTDIENLRTGQMAITKNKNVIAKTSSQRAVKDLLEKSNRQSMIHGIDFEKSMTNRSDIINQCRHKIKNGLPNGNHFDRSRLEKISLQKMIPLGRNTRLNNNGKNTLPVIVEHGTLDEKYEHDRTLRKIGDTNISYVWPKEILNQVNNIKTEMNAAYDRKDFQVKIRPEMNTGDILVQIRKNDENASDFHFVTVVKYKCPVLDDDLRLLGINNFPGPKNTYEFKPKSVNRT